MGWCLMSAQPINHSPDLKKLRDKGYSVYIREGLLIIEDIPYVNTNKEICTGTLISKLSLSGELAAYNNDHVAYFIGGMPCHANGEQLNKILHQSTRLNLGTSIIADMSFSSKPREGYSDYFHKMTTYINIISGPASSLDPHVTPRQYRAMHDDEGSVFEYIDTNASRASIANIVDRMKTQKIGIIGLGGTGSYILDFVAKTPVKEIHLFDGDKFYSHNAFRAPGAAPLEVLNSQISKVDYLKGVYKNMHKGIYAHDIYLDDHSKEALNELDFVFVSIDDGSTKALIFEYLESLAIPFIDVGLGVGIEDGDKLSCMIRTTPILSKSDYDLKKNIDMNQAHDDAYNTNIQIAELNAFNAAMAVMKWKKYSGVYQSNMDTGETLFSISNLHLLRNSNAS